MTARAEKIGLLDVALWALTAVILALGGAGDSYPLVAAIVQSCAVGILLLVNLSGRRHTSAASELLMPAVAVIGIIVLFVLTQLVPIPGSVWSSLPGRSLARDVQSSAGLSPGWHTLSLDPTRTALAALELLPGMAMLVAGLQGTARRRALIVVVLVVAMSSAILGGVQRLSPSSWLYPFDTGLTNSPGIFVNRNHQASFLLTAIPLGAYWSTSHSRFKRASAALWAVLTWGAILILSAAIVLTTSRAGLLLLPVAVGAAAAILHHEHMTVRRLTLVALLVLPAIIAAGQVDSVQRTLDRFSGSRDNRPELAATTAALARQYLPFGSGLGTFQLVYVTGETRDRVTDTYVNDAHDDYAETWLEGGFLALGVLTLLILVVGRRVVTVLARGQSDRQRRAAGTAVAVLTLLALHSTVDYPLRMMTLMAVAGLSMALLLADDHRSIPSVHDRDGTRVPISRSVVRRRRWGAAGTLIAAALTVLVPVWATAIARVRLDSGKALAALAANPWSSDAMVAAGREALDAGDYSHARAFGAQALAISPLNATATGLMVQAAILAGETARADRLLTVARRLGWRDPLIQYALMREAADRKDYGAAVVYADALLRIGASGDLIPAFLRKLERDRTARAALTGVLALTPNWRRSFLVNIQDLDERDVASHMALLGALSASGSPPADSEVDALTRYLLSRHRYGEAARCADRYRRSSATPRIPEAVATASLNETPGSSDPFAWHAGEALGTSVSVTNRGAIEIVSPRATSGTVLSRLFVAGPGPYVITSMVEEASPNSIASLNWSLACEGGRSIALSSPILSRSHDGTMRVDIQFQISDPLCKSQLLSLGVDSSISSRIDVTIDRLSLRQL